MQKWSLKTPLKNNKKTGRTFALTSGYDSQMSSIHRKVLKSSRKKTRKKVPISKAKLKAMIAFFDIEGAISIKWLPKGQTFTQKYYREVQAEGKS